MGSTRAPVEAKTQAAGLAGAVAGAVIYVLQQYVFKHTLNAGLVSLIYAAVPGALAFAAAYLAPHTPRPPAPPAGPVNPQAQIQAGMDYIKRAYGSESGGTSAPLPPPPASQA